MHMHAYMCVTKPSDATFIKVTKYNLMPMHVSVYSAAIDLDETK